MIQSHPLTVAAEGSGVPHRQPVRRIPQDSFTGTQRDHRIDARGPARRHLPGKEPDGRENRHHRGKRCRVGSGHTEQKSAQRASKHHDDSVPSATPHAASASVCRMYPPLHPCRRRAKRHADPNLPVRWLTEYETSA